MPDEKELDSSIRDLGDFFGDFDFDDESYEKSLSPPPRGPSSNLYRRPGHKEEPGRGLASKNWRGRPEGRNSSLDGARNFQNFTPLAKDLEQPLGHRRDGSISTQAQSCTTVIESALHDCFESKILTNIGPTRANQPSDDTDSNRYAFSSFSSNINKLFDKSEKTSTTPSKSVEELPVATTVNTNTVQDDAQDDAQDDVLDEALDDTPHDAHDQIATLDPSVGAPQIANPSINPPIIPFLYRFDFGSKRLFIGPTPGQIGGKVETITLKEHKTLHESPCGKFASEYLAKSVPSWTKRHTPTNYEDARLKWQDALKDMNRKIHGNGERCMQDSDIPHLIGFLESLVHEYMYSQCTPQASTKPKDFAGEVIEMMANCIRIFLKLNDEEERFAAFMSLKSNILQAKVDLWYELFTDNYKTTTVEFKDLLSAPENKCIRNYYSPQTKKFVSVCEFHQDGFEKAHRIFDGHDITTDGTVRSGTTAKEVEYEPKKLSPSTSPPKTPPRGFNFLKGSKICDRHFDKDGNLCIEPSMFFIVNARATGPKKRADDEGLLIIDTEFIKVMDLYVNEYIWYIGHLVAQMAAQEVELSSGHAASISAIFAHEVMTRLALHDKEDLSVIESFHNANLFNTFWQPLYNVYKNTRKNESSERDLKDLSFNLSEILKIAYRDLHSYGKVNLTIEGHFDDIADTAYPGASRALSTIGLSGFKSQSQDDDDDDDDGSFPENVPNDATSGSHVNSVTKFKAVKFRQPLAHDSRLTDKTITRSIFNSAPPPRKCD
ncbi:hypothetical protein H072_5352 [Dactylellina haptotyla CBS 200.50]|uniref:Uncharacterized protein n=1 Tax=Dactylellina haptotyla (strain CBS 200.50) TaxID=1284197 RepID=S8BZF7_DACHA|nr:hypothetical protein H072_5352 [Dactylellina haptotyla CBS 200.50]